MATERLKKLSSSNIDSCKDELQALSESIWRNPELALEEHKAHELLTTFLEGKGFAVDRSYTGIKTAFRATFGSGRPNVCVISEYDALPEIGHACGHNLIAEAGVAAGLGLKAALEEGKLQGTVTVMGTPAEEEDGGKITLIENGAFNDIDVAMMVHPSPCTIVRPAMNALKSLQIKFTGKAAHAAAYPWEGVNALDAAVLAYTSVSVLRQQMKPTWRVHAIISKGGVKPNIIPEYSEMELYCRTPAAVELNVLVEKVISCLNAAAQATGCSVEILDNIPTYLDLKHNGQLAKSFGQNLETLGMKYEDVGDMPGSTDMGNVSYVVPSIHPVYAIGSGEVNHARDFTAVANTPDAHHKTLVAAKAMAHTGIDVFINDSLLEEIKKSFGA